MQTIEQNQDKEFAEVATETILNRLIGSATAIIDGVETVNNLTNTSSETMDKVYGDKSSDTVKDISTVLAIGAVIGKDKGKGDKLGSNNTVPQITNRNLGRDNPGVIFSNISTLPIIREGDSWLKGTNSNAGKVPKQIAEKLNGKEFNSFGEFRSAFWKEVSNDSVLSKQFSKGNIAKMKNGNAPHAIDTEQAGKRQVYELDHNIEIQNGGNVYDLNNIIVRTPYNHIKKTSDTKKAN